MLWNDVAWPAEGKLLWALFEHYYGQVPDGVVNDRWMPWSPILGAARVRMARGLIDAGSRRQARRDGGLIPPTPPHFDFRTPEYVVFSDIEQTPWEYVRGMDRSFGYNSCSRSEDFVTHDELLWQLTDVVAKGGNLLLNVGPRGLDAQIPDEQLERLRWLGAWVPVHHEAIMATRPWVTAGSTTPEGCAVRYSAREDTVFAFLRDATGSITLPEVHASTTTAAEVVGAGAVSWEYSDAGIVLNLPAAASGPEPTVIALRNVEARPVTPSRV